MPQPRQGGGGNEGCDDFGLYQGTRRRREAAASRWVLARKGRALLSMVRELCMGGGSVLREATPPPRESPRKWLFGL